MTAQAEALVLFVERVIETDLVRELDFLRNYDATKSALQAIVDMPDRLIDLFIRLCVQNKGVLSAAKTTFPCSQMKRLRKCSRRSRNHSWSSRLTALHASPILSLINGIAGPCAVHRQKHDQLWTVRSECRMQSEECRMQGRSRIVPLVPKLSLGLSRWEGN